MGRARAPVILSEVGRAGVREGSLTTKTWPVPRFALLRFFAARHPPSLAQNDGGVGQCAHGFRPFVEVDRDHRPGVLRREGVRSLGETAERERTRTFDHFEWQRRR